MWMKLRNWWGWLVAGLLLCVGATTMWKRKRKVARAMRAFEARKKANEATLKAEQKRIREMRKLDQEVADARRTGSLVDRFNK